MSDAYDALARHHGRIATLGEAAAVLHWDRSTVMPDGGAAARAGQLAELAVLIHELETSAELSDRLDEAEARSQLLGEWQRANLREMRRRWRHANAVPSRLVEALSRASSEAEMCWRSARASNDFASLAPRLDALVALVREEADAKAAAFGCAPYDALLDGYDPGRSGEAIDAWFGELESWLPDLLGEVLESQAADRPPLRPDGPFDAQRQHALALRVMEVLGFDFQHGRLDVSHHPFTGGVPEDVRITTRYREGDFAESLMAVIHETGHAQYERGLPSEWRRQPVGDSRGMTLHESQSLLLEMQAGRSPEFIGFLAPLLRDAFSGSGAAYEPANLVRLYHRVEPGLIRVEADEVTYPLHILLRYRVERAWIAGDLTAADLPSVWRDGMRDLLGVVPGDDADGCMQDIHWPSGAFGYFPTYTLGALAAAQLFAAAREARPELPAELGAGELGGLLEWLREQVHGLGCRYEPDELIQRASGAPLSTDAFQQHLRQRYLPG